MSKTFVLDTNVILSDPESIFKFQEHSVVIPRPVFKEIDKFKKEQNEVGRNARQFSRYLDELRTKGLLTDGVPVNDQGGVLKVMKYIPSYGKNLPDEDMTMTDNKILACALALTTKDTTNATILVTKDTNLRISGDIYGVEAQDYENGKVQLDDMYSGCDHLYVSEEIINKIYNYGKIDVSELTEDGIMFPNIGIILHNEANEKHSALCIYDDVMKELVLLPDDQTTMGITPRNAEQKIALALLTNPEIDLVTMTGKAGCGKTLMALLGGMSAIMDNQLYDKLVLLKPIIAADNSHELGFLPGDMDEKLKPWMASYADNLSVIMSNFSQTDLKISLKKSGKKKKLTKAEQEALDTEEEKNAGRLNAIDELKALGLVECGSIEHIRGRSMAKVYIIIDEAQNLSLHALKTIVTRAGVGTKIIVMGDIGQIDSPYLDATSNGLTIIVDRFKEQQIAGHISMQKSERSRLAEIAANIL